MKFKFKNTPEQVELIKATGSRNPDVARKAMYALAELLSPIIDQVLPVIDTTSTFFSEFEVRIPKVIPAL